MALTFFCRAIPNQESVKASASEVPLKAAAERLLRSKTLAAED